MKLTTHLHKMPKLRMSGATPLTSPIRLHGVERVNFTAILTLPLYILTYTYTLVNEVINSLSLIEFRVRERAISVK